MSIKAGRVGVNPADVDPIDGHINPSSLEGYTKEEADAKFETQEAASALQSKTLLLPIELLNGSALTVETALHGINNDFKDSFSRASNITGVEDMTGGTPALVTDIIPTAGYYAVFANAYIKTSGVLAFKINEVDTVVNGSAVANTYSFGFSIIYFDGNTPVTVRCSGNTSAVLNNVQIALLKVI